MRAVFIIENCPHTLKVEDLKMIDKVWKIKHSHKLRLHKPTPWQLLDERPRIENVTRKI